MRICIIWLLSHLLLLFLACIYSDFFLSLFHSVSVANNVYRSYRCRICEYILFVTRIELPDTILFIISCTFPHILRLRVPIFIIRFLIIFGRKDLVLCCNQKSFNFCLPRLINSITTSTTTTTTIITAMIKSTALTWNYLSLSNYTYKNVSNT